MSDTIAQWLIIVVFVIFVPLSYWQAYKNHPIHVAIKLLSYLGAIVIGMLLATILVAAKVISVGPSFIVVIISTCSMHYYLIKRMIDNQQSS